MQEFDDDDDENDVDLIQTCETSPGRTIFRNNLAQDMHNVWMARRHHQ